MDSSVIIERMNRESRGTLMASLGIEFIGIGENLEENHVFGIEINANHVRKAQGSYVIGRAEFIHKGHRTHVVSVNVTDEFGNLASVGRITNVVLPKS